MASAEQSHPGITTATTSPSHEHGGIPYSNGSFPSSFNRDSPNSDQAFTSLQFEDTPLSGDQSEAQTQFTDLRNPNNQTDEAYAQLKNLAAGRYTSCSDKPLKYRVPPQSWYGLLVDPEFERLREAFNFKISYDVSESVLTIFPMSGRRHAILVDWVIERAVLAKHGLEPAIRQRFQVTSNLEFGEFEGEWDGSMKTPDILLEWVQDQDRGFKAHTIVEVASSQTKDALIKLVHDYLSGSPDISRVVLLDITEDPAYRSPDNIGAQGLKDVQAADLHCESDQGPVWHNGVQWVGRTTISWEVWERHAVTGEPECLFSTTFVPEHNGSPLPFFEIPSTIATGVQPVTVQAADVEILRNTLLKPAIYGEARRRMRKFIKKEAQIADNAAKAAEQETHAEERERANQERAARQQARRGY
ncbi:hypothetical protein A1O3_10114 [Capronia epimyces CBS 606.96]|uniref:Uncharacterized protein n=1 Tax=Capronia epimyces CBS 606.96 TaxID=1182542 RepID=W9X918_9EURO|nr:uncharacterized protein A1O3_10114 [Capronia epimyces CBS 606.96]EXJ76957.1 hypothetical protein A1O3_10114 [Capronia epimyces CBS 606.96]